MKMLLSSQLFFVEYSSSTISCDNQIYISYTDTSQLNSAHAINLHLVLSLSSGDISLMPRFSKLSTKDLRFVYNYPLIGKLSNANVTPN